MPLVSSCLLTSFSLTTGTGKTTVLQEIIYQKRKATKGNPNAVAVVAPTNLAAMALGGVTLHAWLGISVDEWADKSAESLERTIRSRDAAATRVKKAEILVMDEVPYLTAEAFDKLDQVIRLLRGVGQTPFGGMPIVMAGDFYQLGPIGPRDPEPGTVLRAAFEGSSWRNGAFEKNFYFTTRYRHRGDRRFIALLDTVRTGTLSEDTLKELTELERPLPADGPPVLG
ncbi:unnamed protein product [Tilletia caries]|nr:unnamed protein product [Tilletia caries]